MQKFNTLFKSKNIFFIAIVIFVLSSFILYQNRDDIFKLFKDKNKDLSQTINMVKKSNLSISEEKNADTIYVAKNKSPLLSIKSFLNAVSSLKFSKTPTTLVKSKLESTPESGLVDYIHYLLNVNLLVYNFLQDEDYSKELRIVQFCSLPQDIRNILINLEAYNNYLISKSKGMEVIFPTNYKWLEQFIRIEKKPSDIIIKEKNKTLILEKLNYLIHFFYSEKFMQEFINKSV